MTDDRRIPVEESFARALAHGYTSEDIFEMLDTTAEGTVSLLRRHFRERHQGWWRRDEAWRALDHLRHIREWRVKLEAYLKQAA